MKTEQGLEASSNMRVMIFVVLVCSGCTRINENEVNEVEIYIAKSFGSRI